MIADQYETEKAHTETEETLRERVRFCVRRLRVASPEFREQRRIECEKALQEWNAFIRAAKGATTLK